MLAGRSSAVAACSAVITRGEPAGTNGGTTGEAPVAITTARVAVSRLEPSGVSTRTLRGPASRPRPRTTSMALLAAAAFSVLSCSVETTRPTRRMNARPSTTGLAGAMPNSRQERICQATAEAASMALVGMQPTLRQMPPSLPASTTHARPPRRATCLAAARQVALRGGRACVVEAGRL
ncbi:MAG: hypothetical protein J7M21_02430, partial [Planctomycetes bacterium]|nr:hypothetical protein [Planctomycetota bacterium]